MGCGSSHPVHEDDRVAPKTDEEAEHEATAYAETFADNASRLLRAAGLEAVAIRNYYRKRLARDWQLARARHRPAYGRVAENIKYVEKMLREGGADANEQCGGFTALFCAADLGHEQAVHLLLAHKANTDTHSGALKSTPLMAAVCNGHSAVCQALIAAGCGLELRDVHGNTALALAADAGDEAICGMLLAAGAQLEPTNARGDTPLMLASDAGHLAICKQLLEAGVSVAEVSVQGTAALIAAEANGHSAVAQLLRAAGADLDLLAAVAKGDDEVCALLLAAGASLDVRDAQGRTPLIVAVERGHAKVCQLLAPRSQVQERSDALLLAIAMDAAAICELLIGAGVDLEQPNTDGKSPLVLAAGCAATALCESLIKAGANVDARSTGKDGHTALMAAVCKGSLGTVRLLLDAYAAIEMVSADEGNTALILAARHPRRDVAEELLRAGAAINTRNAAGRTALITAAAANNFAVAELLVAYGADIEATGAQGDTALSWAVKHKNHPLMDTLKRPETVSKNPRRGGLAEPSFESDLHLLPPPPHWVVTPELLKGIPTFVELPLYPRHRHNAVAAAQVAGGGSDGGDADPIALAQLQARGLTLKQARAALAAAGGNVQAALRELAGKPARISLAAYQPLGVRELLENGIAYDDAVAALEAKAGNVQEALMYCFECAGIGAAALAARRSREARQEPGEAHAPSSGPDDELDAAAAAEAAREQALAQEVAMVKARFAAHKGVSADRIRKIERVQNLMLWSDYARRRKRTSIAVNPVNERQLFHGAEKGTLSTICREGFDIRVSNLGGLLGAGIYFALSSSYSDSYARSGKRTIDPTASSSRLPSLSQPTPSYVPGCVAMLLCDVVLGNVAPGSTGIRRPPDGYHSCSGHDIWAVYDNSLAYPAYCIHYA